MPENEKIVMVFGVFDIIHDGHKHFLMEAKKMGKQLVVVVAQDDTVYKLKGRIPTHTLLQRINCLVDLCIADKVLPGDQELNTWNTLSSVKPDIVALGYDQKKLGVALKTYILEKKINIDLKYVEPYLDGSLHSSKLNLKQND